MDYITAGESHGPKLTAIVSGVPAGLVINPENINADLARRQSGYGRGARQQIERDEAQFTSGIRFGRTSGAPIAIDIFNRDWQNWTARMSHFDEAPADLQCEVTPRPGHADLVGALRTNTHDCRDILERSSARETAARVAACGIAKEFLNAVGVDVLSYVVSIGSAEFDDAKYLSGVETASLADIDASETRCPDASATEAMKQAIDAAKESGESLGGIFRVIVRGAVPGLGSYISGPERLTSKLAAAICSIPAIKGVEFGMGFKSAQLEGSKVHDGIILCDGEFKRASNNAGGLEGGMSTGFPIVVTAAMKPIPTLMNPLKTVNLDSLQSADASRERSDVCAVPAAAVVAEGEAAMVIANAYIEAFGNTCMADIQDSIQSYLKRIESYSK